MSPRKIAICATFTATPLAETLSFWLRTLDLPDSIEFTPHQQLTQQLLDPHSLLAQNHDGLNILLLRLEDWLDDQPLEALARPQQRKNGAAHSVLATLTRHSLAFEQALQTAVARQSTPHLLCLCPLSPQILADAQLEATARQISERIASLSSSLAGVQLMTPAEISRWYPLPAAAVFDPVSDQMGDIPFTSEFLAALSSSLARKIYRLTQPPPKVIVLDCDHTLWRGVCAEDSPTELSIEGPWRYLQKFMVAQGDAGRLLCLCSKNHEVDVMRVFAQRPDMPLRGEHLVAWRINWRPKSENLRSLADELQLSLDSFIYIDDNPLECAEVQANCPEVVTLQLPADPSQIPAFLDHVWAFDLGQTTTDDRQRQRRYRQARERNQWSASGLSYADFLAGLELEVRIATLRLSHLSRAAQLTQRVNQFTVTTARHSETELRRSLESHRWEALEVEVRDRFGDYGLVGLILFASQPEALVVDTFLLSCRVLGRGVEYQMLVRLGQIAVERQLSLVILPYRPTARNQPAFEFLLAVGHQYRSTEESRIIFNLPAAIATTVHFDVQTQQKRRRAASQLSEREQPVPSGNLHADLLVRIATELATPSQLLQAVQLGRERSQAEATTELRIPETAQEVLLAAQWADLLGLEQVGRHDDFFERGGDSLLATQLSARIHRACGVSLALHQVFENPTLWELAKVVAAAEAHAQPVSIPALSSSGRAPLSFAQQRLWFLEQIRPGNPANNVPLAIRLHGRLDRQALSHSLAEITRRHELLRTTFGVKSGQPIQIVHSFDTWQALLALQAGETTTDLSLSHLTAAEQMAEIERLASHEARQPFDLAQGPLMRSRLFHLNAAGTEHLWLLTFHQMAIDRWSIHQFFAELSQLYAGFVSGEPAEPPPLPIQYGDYALWQRQQSWPDEWAYWQEQLADLPELQLFTDYPRPAAPDFAGATHCFEIPQPLVEPLRALSRKARTTLFMTMLAAFEILLHRYSGQTDFSLGIPIANRSRGELEHLIGLMANTLLLRANLAGNPTFLTVLERVRQKTLAAYTQPSLPFERLGELLDPEHRGGQPSLGQVNFCWQNEPPLQALRLPETTVELLPVETGATSFDLSLEITETGEQLSAACTYSTALFSPATIERMTGHFLRLLAGIVADPLQSVATLPLLTEGEQHQLLQAWNQLGHPATAGHRSLFETLGRSVADVSKRLLHQVTGFSNGQTPATVEPDPAAGCFHHLFEAQAARTPEAVAVIAPRDGVKITYAQLNRWANQVAHYLRAHGVGPEVLVGLCVDRSLNMIVGLLGILKAGGAYLPLDPNYPARRLAFMLADARISVLLTEAHLTGTPAFVEFVERGGKLVRLSKEWPVMSRFQADNPANPESPVSLAHLATVIFTSGSTGRPTGVMIEHRALSWYARTAQTLYGLRATDRVLQFSSISHDTSLEEIFPCLLSGGTLVLHPQETFQTVSHFLQKWAEWEISALFLPTNFWHEVAGRLTAEPALLPSTLRLLKFQGEKVRPERVAAWQRTFSEGQVQLLTGYGPTENTAIATLHTPLAAAETSVPPFDLIGRAVPGVQVYVLDEHLQPVPIGVPGQLYLGGAGLARGYRHRPELTAQAFVEHPFAPGERLYKTGDWVRYRPDGQLEYLERLDQRSAAPKNSIKRAENEPLLKRRPGPRALVTPSPMEVRRQLVGASTPAQVWSLSHKLPEPHLLNEAALVEMETAPNMILLARAVKELIRHHHVLRVDFDLEGGSSQPSTGSGRRTTPRQPAPLIDVDMADLPALQQQEMIQTVAVQLHDLIRPADGRLIEFALFTCGRRQPAQLLIVAHQRVIAEIPWSVLLADLQTAYSYLSQGQAVHLLSKTAVQ